MTVKCTPDGKIAGMTKRISTASACLLAASFLISTGCSSESARAADQGQSTAAPAQAAQAKQADPLWLADDLPRLPTGVVMGVRPVSVMRATYEFAARRPEVMHYVPCFCGCERGGHKDNHDCFVGARDANNRVTSWDTHAIGCEICVDVAYQALQMHNSGASVSAIRDAIEKKYAAITAEGRHTPTPMPKRGGSSHD